MEPLCGNLSIRERLFALQDENYRDFSAKLVPNIDSARVIGVRSPALRSLAKELSGTEEAAAFLEALPHDYLEENHLHGFLIESIRDYDACVKALDAFLPFVDNWATCDCIGPACFSRNHVRLIEDVRRWLESDALYTKRFAIRMLMNHFLDGDFRREFMDWVAAIETEEYYLRMMQAWYFATALAKQYGDALPFIESCRLEPWTHNKAIQKAVESRRLGDEQKAYLKTLKVRT
jgi:DNA alkylation repair enzyme.